MSDIALRVEGLGKRYRLGLRENSIGQAHYRYKSLRDSLGKIARRPLKTLRNSLVRQPMSDANSFWALKDINLQVKRGEVVGIIGRNGAGKSTLLKILSRITKPTTGQVDLFGRVGSLLEVGTGFHPELSGRENIYLNGAILGMTRAEVRQKFDEIVAFSEVEKFLDTPVKQYSSGMHMRLAFAVAAHLEPEILIVDEVLAVGDAAFQKKCFGKMKDVADKGRTVLLVSHNTSAVHYLCNRGVLLRAGEVCQIGPVDEVLAKYLETMNQQSRSVPNARQLGRDVSLVNIGFEPGTVKSGSAATVSVTIEALQDTAVSHLCVLIHAASAVRVAILDLRSATGAYQMKGSTKLRIDAEVPRLDMVEGEYQIGLFIDTGNTNAFFYELAPLFVTAADVDSSGPVPYEPSSRGFLDLRIGEPRARIVNQNNMCSGTI